MLSAQSCGPAVQHLSGEGVVAPGRRLRYRHAHSVAVVPINTQTQIHTACNINDITEAYMQLVAESLRACTVCPRSTTASSNMQHTAEQFKSSFVSACVHRQLGSERCKDIQQHSCRDPSTLWRGGAVRSIAQHTTAYVMLRIEVHITFKAAAPHRSNQHCVGLRKTHRHGQGAGSGKNAAGPKTT